MKMTRWLSVLMLALALPLLVQAQGEKAYAPEDLSKLTQPEQVRVLEKQYA
ncbi:MAG: hypothetical protein JNL89_17050, partial [Rhodanobacteraceae bacterium]|nr:hypothetical protein [Rhodanobacteraceae bacterium]